MAQYKIRGNPKNFYLGKVVAKNIGLNPLHLEIMKKKGKEVPAPEVLEIIPEIPDPVVTVPPIEETPVLETNEVVLKEVPSITEEEPQKEQPTFPNMDLNEMDMSADNIIAEMQRMQEALKIMQDMVEQLISRLNNKTNEIGEIKKAA